MTGPVEFLEAAHKRAEETARATTPVPKPGEWIATRDKHAADDAPLALIQGRDEETYDWLGEDYRSGLPVIAYAAEWQDEAEANLHHIALNDPHSVLRRVAAERELLTLHQNDAGKCSECSQGYELQDWGPDYPCATVRLLAKGWGWAQTDTPSGTS